MAELDFYQQLILVIIPTVAAFVTTKFVAESWQDRKEKYRLQKEILSEIDNSILHYVNAMQIFGLQIWFEYVYAGGDPYEDEVTEDFKFPEDNTAELPEQKFKEEFEEFDNELYRMYKTSSLFESTLDLYYGVDNNLKELWTNLRYESFHLNEKLEDLYYSTKKKEYLDAWFEFWRSMEKLRMKIAEFRTNLLERKLKKYQI